jgi:hypothetical protein
MSTMHIPNDIQEEYYRVTKRVAPELTGEALRKIARLCMIDDLRAALSERWIVKE